MAMSDDWSVQRVFTEKRIARELAGQLAEAASALTVGDPTLPGTEVGPLIREAEVTRVGEWVAESGGEVLAGGIPISSRAYAPTVLYDPSPDAKVSTLRTWTRGRRGRTRCRTRSRPPCSHRTSMPCCVRRNASTHPPSW